MSRAHKFQVGLACGHTLRVGHAKWDGLKVGGEHMCGQCGKPRSILGLYQFRAKPKENDGRP